MSKKTPKFFLMAVHGAVTVGKPLPMRPGAISGPVIPVAEVLPQSVESQVRCYSIKEFAAITGLSESTIKREIQDKRLKAIKRRRRKVITHEDGMAYLSSLPPDEAQIPQDENGGGVDRTHGE